MRDLTKHREYLSGKMLIAMPNMEDERFERSVVLICSHENDHAMGVVINKIIREITIGDLLEQLRIEADQNISISPVYYGGPVQQDRGLVIHTLDYRSETTMVVGDNIGVTGTREILADLANHDDGMAARPAKYLLALGHAGWSSGQLEEEIQMNVWAHCDADERIVFADKNTDAWQRALNNLGVTTAMLSPEWARGRDMNAPLN